MKKITILSFCLLLAITLVAQKKEDNILKNSLNFNFGKSFLTRGDIIGYYFKANYTHNIRNRIGIGFDFCFTQGGYSKTNFEPFKEGFPIIAIINSKNNNYELAGAKILNEYTRSQTHSNFGIVVKYSPIKTHKHTLNLKLGIGLGYIQDRYLSESLSAFISPWWDIDRKSYVKGEIYSFVFSRVIDINYPGAIEYRYNFNDKFFINTEAGAVFYNKAGAFYWLAGIGVGANF